MPAKTMPAHRVLTFDQALAARRNRRNAKTLARALDTVQQRRNSATFATALADLTEAKQAQAHPWRTARSDAEAVLLLADHLATQRGAAHTTALDLAQARQQLRDAVREGRVQ